MLYETISYFPSVGALTAKVLWLIVICTQPVDGEKIEYIETGFNLNLGLIRIEILVLRARSEITGSAISQNC
jgi:hypothetical protein